MKKYIVLLFLILFQNLYTHAQTFKINIVNYDGIENIPALKNLIDNQVQDFEDKVNDRLPNGSQGRIMKSMANSNVLVGKNIGSDYTSNLEIWMIGASINGAVDLEKNGASDISGFGLAPGVNAGVNLGRMGVENFAGLDTDKLNFYVNFLKLNYDQKLYQRTGVEADGKLKTSTIGFRFRYNWIQGNDKKGFGWTGVKLHWGYQYTDTTYILDADINKVISVANSDGAINGTIRAKPKVRIDIETHSIPLEISTEARLLYFLSVFGGAGADLSVGRAKGKANASSEVSPLICTGGGTCGGNKLLQVQVDANLDSQKYISNIIYRAFGGIQINLPYVNIYAMVDKAIGRDLLGGSVGIRFVY